jgi:Kef-type K+ transport system membrane component KefB
MHPLVLAAEVTVEYRTLAAIFFVALLAPLVADLLSSRVRLPAVVLELGFGILIGPAVLGIAVLDGTVDFLAELGVAFLIFLAGYEIDVPRVRGTPLQLAAKAWFSSLALGLVVGVLLMDTGIAVSGLVIGLCLTTTALGTLLPMLRDDGLLPTPYGTHVLAGGALGEFGPIVAIAVLLSTDNPARSSAALLGFTALAVAAIVVALRARPPRLAALLVRTLHSSGQMAVRLVVLTLVLLVWLASALGLDILLGAFLAGLLGRLFFQGFDEETRHQIDAKLDGVGFGFFIPLFFVVSGMAFDLDALLSSWTNVLRVPLFLALFLAVRGLPVWWLYRNELPERERRSLAVITSTALPLVVVITKIGLDTGRMRPENASSLVGAAMLSVLLFPLVARRLRSTAGPDPELAVTPESAG